MSPIIRSMLDQDTYKLSMGQAVLFGRFGGVSYQSIDVVYEFINRGITEFPSGFAAMLREQVDALADLVLTDAEAAFLGSLRYIKRAYIDFLRGFRYDPSAVRIQQDGGVLSISIRGPWYKTIYFEVPLLALVSEIYHKLRNHQPDAEYLTRARHKGIQMAEAGARFADFGMRRRFSFDVQDSVVRALKEAHGRFPNNSTFVGTSNVHLAMKYGLTPIGTHAHEFFMALAALFGFRLANQLALESWDQEFAGDLGTALTDTFTSEVFFRQFSMHYSKLFDGVRHDSGDPVRFAQQAIAHYKSMRIDPLSKTIIFSDGLDVPMAIMLHKWCQGQIGCAFGIGTNLTCDIAGVKPLNIVIKMSECNGVKTVKLSDVDGKNTGDSETLRVCKFQLGIQ